MRTLTLAQAHPNPQTLHPKAGTPNLAPTLNPQPDAHPHPRTGKTQSLNPAPETRNQKHQTFNAKAYTLNPHSRAQPHARPGSTEFLNQEHYTLDPRTRTMDPMRILTLAVV